YVSNADHPPPVHINSFLISFVQFTHTFMCSCDIRYPAVQPLFHFQQPDVLGGCHILCMFVVLAADDEDTGLRLRRSEQPRSEFPDRKSTRLNSSHVSSSYAVFCLTK